MTSPTFDPHTLTNQVITNANSDTPNLQEQILNQLSLLKSLVKLHNDTPSERVTPIRLSFRDEPGTDPPKGPEVEESKDKDEDLYKPHKETLDDLTQSWFDHMPSGGIDNWDKLREGFVERFALRKRCCKEPVEATRIIRRENETLSDFKERWIQEMIFVPDVPVVMQISSFVNNSKCPELARRFANRVPMTITEMMKRVDDFVKSKEAYKSTELPKGEHQEKSMGIPFKGNRPPRQGYGNSNLRADNFRNWRNDLYQPYVSPRSNNRRFDGRHQEVYNVVLESLRKQPKEILAIEPQLQLPPCPSTVGSPKKENLDRYCDYHANNEGRGKVINMVWENTNYRKRKTRNAQEEAWLDALITFPSVLPDEVLDDPLIIEAEVEGYLVKRVSHLTANQTELVGFSGEQLLPLASPNSGILGRIGMRELRAKKPVPEGERAPEQERIQAKEEAMLVNSAFPDQKLIFRTQFSEDRHSQLINLLRNNLDVFSWEPSDMAGVPKRIAKHTLNVNRSVTPVAQKQRILMSKKSQAVLKEVQEWLKAGIIRPVKYPTWISNSVLVKKVDDTWRMCIDFKNLNFEYEEDEEKIAFYTDQGTYYYTKMPFVLKNAGATYQRVVDSALQTHLGRNLEAYVDDMVIKSKTERDMVMDIAETFHNLQKINLKLNPKKCSFGVIEGKFLGYMFTSEGIRANPKKTKAVFDMQSPKTLRETQSLSEKLAALNRVLSKLAERSLPFFEMLKNITKENKDEYRWIEAAEKAFQELKKLIMELPTLTTPIKKEPLFIYLATSRDAVIGVLIAERVGRFHNEIPAGVTSLEICTLVNGESEEAWTLYIDGALSLKGAGLVLIDPSGIEYTYAIRLTFTSTNNEAEYESLLAGLKIAHKMKLDWEGREWDGGRVTQHPMGPPNHAKTSNGETPFSLTCGSEVVITAEIGMPTYRTLLFNEAQNEEDMRLNLDLTQERREAPAIQEAKYKKKVEQYYNKRVRPVSFRVGDFVYRKNAASRVENQGKLGPNWEGPYRVIEAYDNGSYKLATMDDKEVPRTWHAINLRNCFM
nr:hypothetical protein [Tanacetum cinerariifolium]